MPQRFLSVVLLVTGVVLGSSGPAAAVPRPIPPFAVVTHVASGQPAAASAWLDAQLAEANQHFKEAGIGFCVVERRALPRSFVTMETIRERVRLRRHFIRRRINIFIVDTILDPNPSASTRRAARRLGFKPSGQLAGAHIRAGRKRVPKTYILVARSTSTLTLTHELGHFFWAPHHKDPTNIMSYGWKRDHFDKKQLKAFRVMGLRYWRRRVVRVVPKCTDAAHK